MRVAEEHDGANETEACGGNVAELAQFGVRVLTIAPGLIKTPMMAGLPEEIQESLGASVPFPKRLGRPEEFSDTVMHIIASDYLNGEVIRLDGAIRLAPR